MATYYVDPTAGVNGSGTFESPFNVAQTPGSNNVYLFKEATTTIVTADIFAVGLTNLSFGTYESTTGSRIYPTVIGRKSCGAPLFDWSRMALVRQTGSAQFVFNISNNTNYVIDGLRINYAGSHATPIAVGSTSTSSGPITIQRVELSHDIAVVNAAAQGIQIGNGSPVSIERVTVRWCYIHDIATDAIFYAGGSAGFDIAHNVIERVSMTSANGDGIQITGPVTNGLVRHNYVDHRDIDSKQSIICSSSSGSGLLIEGNHCYGYEGGANHTAIYTSHPNSVVRCNYVTGGVNGINMEGTNGLATGNVIMCLANVSSGKYSGFRIGATGVPQIIEGNTIVKTATKTANASTALDHLNSAYTITFRNNLVMGFDQGLTLSASGYTESNNAFWDNTSNSNRSLGAGDVTDDPIVSGSYKPMHGSPLLSAGYHRAYTRDFALVQRPNPPSIGAHDGAVFSAYEAP